MKQKYTKGILSATFVAIIGFGAAVIGVIPQNSLPQFARPFASVLISADEDYVDAPCTPETCGESDFDDSVIVDEPEKEEEEKEPVEEPKVEPKVEPQEPTCSADTWSCSGWNACTDKGVQYRSCTMTNDCEGVDTPSPSKATSCTYTAPVRAPVVTEEPTHAAAPEPTAQETSAENTPPALTAAPVSVEEIQAILEKEVLQINGAESEKVQIAHLKEMAKIVDETPAFTALLGKEGIQELQQELAERQAETPLYIVAQSPKEVEAQRQADTERVTAVANELQKNGADKATIEVAIKQEIKKISAERTREQVRTFAAKKYNVSIKDNAQDSNNDGFSDDAAVLFGGDPNANIEKILYGAAEMPTPEWSPKAGGAMPTPEWMPLTLGLKNGTELNKNGFTAHIGGTAGLHVKLEAVDQMGNVTILGSADISENNRALIVVDREMPAGPYGIQARAFDTVSALPAAFGAASTLTADGASGSSVSKPAIVKLTDSQDIDQPTVKNIQNLDIAGLRDIKVSLDGNGKIKVRGSADIDAAVIGTFQSAVFTSAILADVNTGLFEVNSSGPLEAGDHTVTVYSTNPTTGSQSKPVRVAFSIVSKVDEATGKTEKTVTNVQTTEQGDPTMLIVVSGSIGLALLVVLGLLMRKKSE